MQKLHDNLRLDWDRLFVDIQDKITKFTELSDFQQKVELVFGNTSPSEVRQIIQELIAPNNQNFPQIAIITAEEIMGAKGAYAARNNTIYLSREFLEVNQDNLEVISSVIIEEIGHAIDAKLNTFDTAGDEGELFSKLIFDEELSQTELARIQAEDDSAIAIINGETIEIEQSNFNWLLTEGYGSFEESVSISDSEDFYNFSLLATGGTENYVRISSNFANVDLDLELFDESGTSLDISQSEENTEEVSLSGLPPGTYEARVYNYEGIFNSNPGNADYLLEINLPAAIPPIAQDAYEDNDSFATAVILDNTDGNELIENLTIDSQNDTDYFRFTTGDISTDDDFVATYYDETEGNIDFNLYDSSGAFLANAFGSDGWNYISLSGLPAGTYYVQAGSYQQQTNPNYTIGFFYPTSLSGDRFETENDIYNLGNIAGFGLESDLSLHTESDIDFYNFTISGQTTDQHYIGIDFENSQGDLDLALYDSENRLIDYQVGVTDGEYISLQGLQEGTYQAEVYSLLGEKNEEYDLIFNAPGNGSEGSDSLEGNNGNDGRDTATILRNNDWQQEQGFAFWENLSISQNDEDWFEFEITQEAQTGHYIGIAFDNFQGDLDLELYNAAGNAVATANGTDDVEFISLVNLPVGSYRARVYGYDGATNPNYTLAVNTPGGDRFENNNSQAEAEDLTDRRTSYFKSYENLSIGEEDEDWFKFELPVGITASDYVSISFDHSLGDLDLEIYDDRGDEIQSSVGVGNNEIIYLSNLRTPLRSTVFGDYFIRVFGYNGAENPDYTLTINAPIINNRDNYESNDSLSDAYDLNQQLRDGQQVITLGNDIENPLSIHSEFAFLDDTPLDIDWFKFNIVEDGQQGNYAAISFDHILGDLDLELYDAEEQLLESAEGVSNFHQIGLEDLTAGTYYLKVFGYEEATNPRYTLTVDAPFTEVTDDSSEVSDAETETSADALDLGILDGLFNRGNLSITESDTDWFKFTLAGEGSRANEVSINFNHQQGDLDIELYGSDGESLLDSSLSVSSNERISLNGYAAGDYYLKVFGYDGATNPEYSLTIDAPENTTGDWAEVRGELTNNNSVGNAYDLRDVEGLQTWDTFSLHNGTDEDWYRIELLENATANNYAQIFFNNTLGDIDLSLYD